MDDAHLLEKYFDKLWPICRSIMGEGYRTSLKILSESVPFDRLDFKTGTRVFDWVVPPEWVVRDAYFVDPFGKKHAEFKKNNLHLINYSAPFKGKLPLSELRSHLHTLPEEPGAIPYLTSYYKPQWGFCLTHDEMCSLQDGIYEIIIDTAFKSGCLEIGEAVLPGQSKQEIFFSTYLCHPSLANNELSGPLVLSLLYQKISKLPQRRFTYRFAIMPETIGAICYLKKRGNLLKKNLISGYQMSCLGDRGTLTYKLSRDGNTMADRAAQIALRSKTGLKIIPFNPAEGSDERQYCSPGFNLPVGSLMRTPYAKYSEYHTSLDNKAFIDFGALADSVQAYLDIVVALENNFTWKNQVMYGEPQLGRRGLYRSLSTSASFSETESAMWWLLNLADGTRDLFDVSSASAITLGPLIEAARILENAGLLRKECDFNPKRIYQQRSRKNFRLNEGYER